jgi:hypothetical protein
LEVNRATTYYKGQGNGGMKVIKVEGGREKKEVIVQVLPTADQKLLCMECFKK